MIEDLPVDVVGPQASEPGHFGVHGQADRHVPQGETWLLFFGGLTFRNLQKNPSHSETSGGVRNRDGIFKNPVNISSSKRTLVTV